ncbi:TlpA family protein disulfide reductase [Gilvibacter sp.]|uniref:TlpA family protein disulfide reductase n=1 Tax=Gilvibacter sp. TaxID=2729997 RepID=UPI003B517F0F
MERMFKKYLIPLSVLLPLFFGACKSDKQQEINTWFGGEIINPRADFVLLAKNSRVVDTIFLDKDNFFRYKFDSLVPGLYSFIHKEYQLVYIEPGDSIMLRVNTLDFDESLAYSGTGAAKNNYLIEMFLHNEEEQKLMPSYYQKSPEAFSASLDSMRNIRLKILNRFQEKHETSTGFNEVAQASIDFDYYSKKELYPFAHYGSNHLENMNSLPENFYAFRSGVNYGDEHLYTYYPYYRYISSFLDNVSYTTYMNRAKFDRTSPLHTKAKLKLIDSVITHDSLKNNLLYATTRRYLINSKDQDSSEEIFDLFMQKNSSKAQHKEMKMLHQACDKMIPGNPLPNQMVVTTDNTIKDLHSLINRPTVLFFWSAGSSNHNKRIHKKAAEMKAKYPEFDFVGISVDQNHDKWLKTMALRTFNEKTEYRFNDAVQAERELVLNSPNKAIIVDARGRIIENNTNIFGSSFEVQLLGYLNRVPFQ